MIVSIHYYAGMLEAASIADRYCDVEPNLAESDNPETTKLMARVMSSTAKRIVDEIRHEAMKHRPTVRESIQTYANSIPPRGS